MSPHHKSKWYDHIHMFNNTSRSIDDIFTIDIPAFEKHIPDIYPTKLQLKKANTSDKDTSFLDLDIKVICSDVHTNVYDKRYYFGFPIVTSPCLIGDVPRLPSYGIYISQLIRFARYCARVWISILKIFKSLQTYLDRVTDITSFENIWKVLQVIL